MDRLADEAKKKISCNDYPGCKNHATDDCGRPKRVRGI
jgi:hypothetical protein